MKLAVLHPYQFRYKRGIERYTWAILNEMTRQNVDTHLFTWRWPQPVAWESSSTIHVQYMPYTRYFMAKFAVLYYFYQLIRGKFDWVVIFFAGYGEAEALHWYLRFNPAQKVAIVFHYPYQQVPHRYAEFKKYNLVKRATLIIGVSDYVAQGVRDYFGTDCQVVPNGVDLAQFEPSAEKRHKLRLQHHISTDTPILITLAAFEERKGVQWVIRALPRLLDDFPDLQYWVLGDGAYRAELEAEIEHLNLADHVKLWGQQTDVISFLNAVDVGLLLSYGEAFPITLVEYMAMQLPVITSQHPPFDTLVQNEWGARIDEQDTSALTHLLRDLLNNPARRQQMGIQGRQIVVEKYTWSALVQQYLTLLQHTGTK